MIYNIRIQINIYIIMSKLYFKKHIPNMGNGF